MNTSFRLNSPLQSIFWPRDSSLTKQTFLILAGTLLLAFASQLSIPLVPVPLTFQSVTVILIGMAYGARCGSYVMMAYLAAGLCGLPVFEGFGAGPEKFLGPTGGYLVGFLPAAALSGYLAEKGWSKSILASFMAALMGVSIIFLFGVTVLSRFVGLESAIALGVMPFIISEPIKLLVVACLVPRCWKKA